MVLVRPPQSLDVLETYRTSTITEADLIDGYAGAVRIERCGCGGVITAHETRRAIEYAVRTHNGRPSHVAWAIRNGWRHA